MPAATTEQCNAWADVRLAPDSGAKVDAPRSPKGRKLGHPHAPTRPTVPATGIASSKIEPSESDLTSRNLPPWFATNRKTDSEPQSHTAGLCRKERIEDALSILDRNSGSGVLDRQQYGRVTVETRCEPQTPCFRGHGAHCVDSVS